MWSLIREFIHSFSEKTGVINCPLLRKKGSKCFTHCYKNISPSELLSKTGQEEQSNLIQKLIGEGETSGDMQPIIGCSAKMISNALKWRRKSAATVKTDRRIVRMAKILRIIISRKIKDDLEWSVSTDTVRRRLIEAKLLARSCCKAPLLKKKKQQRMYRIGSNLSRNKSKWPKEKWRNILWTDDS